MQYYSGYLFFWVSFGSVPFKEQFHFLYRAEFISIKLFIVFLHYLLSIYIGSEAMVSLPLPMLVFYFSFYRSSQIGHFDLLKISLEFLLIDLFFCFSIFFHCFAFLASFISHFLSKYGFNLLFFFQFLSRS